MPHGTRTNPFIGMTISALPSENNTPGAAARRAALRSRFARTGSFSSSPPDIRRGRCAASFYGRQVSLLALFPLCGARPTRIGMAWVMVRSCRASLIWPRARTTSLTSNLRSAGTGGSGSPLRFRQPGKPGQRGLLAPSDRRLRVCWFFADPRRTAKDIVT